MRVLLVTGAYFPEFSSGGLQSQAVSRLLKDRVEFVVLTTATDITLPSHALVDGIRVSRVGIDVNSRWSAATAAWRMLRELMGLMPRVDLVHVQGFSSKNILISFVAKLFRRPVILHLQTSKHDEPAAIAAQGRLAWWAFTSADLYLSVSRSLMTPYLESGLPAAKIRLAPNGVDPVRFTPPRAGERRQLRAQLGLPVDRPLTLFVGVMSRDKQPAVLFQAWLRLQADPATASTLVFVGATNPALFELGERVAEGLRGEADRSGFGDRVLFVPPTAQIQDYFRAADVFAMPSAREGLPIVLLEAMACGVPAVASRLPGSTDTIIASEENGLLVPTGDVQALAEALAFVLTNPDEAARLGAAGRQTVEERYSFSRVADQWMTAYRDVLGAL